MGAADSRGESSVSQWEEAGSVGSTVGIGKGVADHDWSCGEDDGEFAELVVAGSAAEPDGHPLVAVHRSGLCAGGTQLAVHWGAAGAAASTVPACAIV